MTFGPDPARENVNMVVPSCVIVHQEINSLFVGNAPTATDCASVEDESGEVSEGIGTSADEVHQGRRGGRPPKTKPKPVMPVRLEEPLATGQPRADRKCGPSSKRNEEWEVGNIGLTFINYGQRATSEKNKQKAHHDNLDRQIMKGPTQVLGMAEATQEIIDVLTATPKWGEKVQDTSNPQSRLDGRPTASYRVVRQQTQDQTCLLLAVKEDFSPRDPEVLLDITQRDGTAQNGAAAYSKFFVVRTFTKQGIGFIGHEHVVALMHLHRETAKLKWKEVLKKWYDKIEEAHKQFGLHFLMGDFNMNVTDVPRQLRNRGICCDVVAWYPWKTAEKGELAWDSCAIFWLRGDCEARMEWDYWDTKPLWEGETQTLRPSEWLSEYPQENGPGKNRQAAQNCRTLNRGSLGRISQA